MRTKLALFAAAIIFLASCKTGSNFTSRRYMAGHYKANHAHVKKPDAQTMAHSSKKPLEKYSSGEKLNEQPAVKSDLLIASSNPKKVAYAEKKHKLLNNLLPVSTRKTPKLIGSIKEMFKKPAKNELRSGKGDEKISTKSLIGFACGVGGIAIDVICFLIAVAALSYAPLIGMIFGLALGIVGIIFGTQGIKDYKSSRNTPTLVFGIVGAATGLAAIILAIYLGLYGALLVTAYLI
jgi:hypothetical protein